MKLHNVFFKEDNYLWLLKPADLNRGNGIHLFRTLELLEILLTKYYTNEKPMRCRKFVVQKYIERPFLINGRKFDIRVWALLTH